MATFQVNNKKKRQNKNVKMILGWSTLILSTLVFLFSVTSLVPALQDFFLGILGIFVYPLCVLGLLISLALLNNKKYVMPKSYAILLSLSLILFLSIIQLIVIGGAGELSYGQYIALNYTKKFTAGGMIIGFIPSSLVYLMGAPARHRQQGRRPQCRKTGPEDPHGRSQSRRCRRHLPPGAAPLRREHHQCHRQRGPRAQHHRHRHGNAPHGAGRPGTPRHSRNPRPAQPRNRKDGRGHPHAEQRHNLLVPARTAHQHDQTPSDRRSRKGRAGGRVPVVDAEDPTPRRKFRRQNRAPGSRVHPRIPPAQGAETSRKHRLRSLQPVGRHPLARTRPAR